MKKRKTIVRAHRRKGRLIHSHYRSLPFGVTPKSGEDVDPLVRKMMKFSQDPGAQEGYLFVARQKQKIKTPSIKSSNDLLIPLTEVQESRLKVMKDDVAKRERAFHEGQLRIKPLKEAAERIEKERKAIRKFEDQRMLGF